jgi:hypothetical protein
MRKLAIGLIALAFVVIQESKADLPPEYDSYPLHLWPAVTVTLNASIDFPSGTPFIMYRHGEVTTDTRLVDGSCYISLCNIELILRVH